MYLPDVPNIYFGDDDVQKVFLGNELVWPAVPYDEQYFTIYVLSGGTLNINRLHNLDYQTSIRGGAVVDYSVNGGAWETSVPAGGPYQVTPLSGITVSPGDLIRFRGDYTGWDTYRTIPYTMSFSGSTCTFNAFGNINSLLFGDNFSAHTNETVEYGYAHLFENSNIISAANLITPTGVYHTYTFFETFYGCSNLLYGPELRCSSYTSSQYGTPFTEAFYACGSLRNIKLPYLESVHTYGFARWVYGVPATGTFVKKAGVSYNVSPPNASWRPCGIPDGWTVIEV